jgi:hypothetical protein
MSRLIVPHPKWMRKDNACRVLRSEYLSQRPSPPHLTRESVRSEAIGEGLSGRICPVKPSTSLKRLAGGDFGHVER